MTLLCLPSWLRRVQIPSKSGGMSKLLYIQQNAFNTSSSTESSACILAQFEIMYHYLILGKRTIHGLALGFFSNFRTMRTWSEKFRKFRKLEIYFSQVASTIPLVSDYEFVEALILSVKLVQFTNLV